MANSIEEQIEGYYKEKLKDLGVRFYAKNEPINTQISTALANSVSKGGGSGMNYPDIKLLLENSTRRDIPVMIEAKGVSLLWTYYGWIKNVRYSYTYS